MPYTAYNRLQFRTLLRDRLGNSIFWNDAELNNAINESLRTWNLLTGDWGARHVYIGSSAAIIALPSTIVSSTRIDYGGKQLIQTSVRDLDDGKPGWITETGASAFPRFWAPIALNLIAIYPHPTLLRDALTIDGITRTPIMSADNNTVDLDASLFNILLDYARHLLLFKLGGEEFEQSKSARKNLWAYASKDNQRIQASAPYRRVMGFPLDSTRQPLISGTKKIGIR